MIHWRVVLAVAPHSEQRYNTTGDWYAGGGVHRIVASRMDNEDFEFLIWLHELVEWFLCHRRGITAQQVDAFDLAQVDCDDPGALPDAPYHREHTFANRLMDLMAEELGVKVADLDAAEDALMASRADAA